jgi:DNA-binding transcriptional LysR family regulator
MNITGMDLNLLVAFDAIYRTQSLTRASSELGLSQPAVSHALARLRVYFNDPLFRRTSHGMRATDRANEVALPIQRMLQLVQDCLHPTQKEKPPGLVFSRSLYGDIAPILEQLRQEMPNVHYPVQCILVDGVYTALQEGKGDIGLVLVEGFSKERLRGMLHRHVLCQPTLLMMADHHPLARQRRIGLSQLAREDFIWFPPRLTPKFYRAMNEACLEEGFSFNIKQEVTQHEDLLSALITGRGIAFVPAGMRNLKTPGVILKEVDGWLPSWNYSLIWRKKQLEPLTERTLEALTKICATLNQRYTVNRIGSLEFSAVGKARV